MHLLFLLFAKDLMTDFSVTGIFFLMSLSENLYIYRYYWKDRHRAHEMGLSLPSSPENTLKQEKISY